MSFIAKLKLIFINVSVSMTTTHYNIWPLTPTVAPNFTAQLEMSLVSQVSKANVSVSISALISCQNTQWLCELQPKFALIASEPAQQNV